MTEESQKRKVQLRFINRARSFFKRIGLPFREVPSYHPDPPNSFFTGCWLDKGCLYYCPARVSVGELLHEAGHLALTPKDQWQLIQPGALELYPPLGDLREIGDAAVEAWDYAAALSADIPELAVFVKGFDGNGLKVWESFDAKMHPGFTLLRFLGMSSSWGNMDRWFVPSQGIPPGRDGIIDLLELCSRDECKAILGALKARLG